MSKKKVYYKVLSPGQMSYCQGQPEELTIHYKEGEWTYPKIKGTNLFICDNMEAVFFWKGSDNLEIWKVEVKRPNKKGLFVEFLSQVDQLYSALKIKNQHKKICKSRYRTTFCSAVKLVKRIY